jgi:shikimate dehydrogenase
MTPTSPLVIVTAPGRTVSEVRHEVELSRDGGADMVEVRLDRWSVDDRANAGELFPSGLPLVATLRSRSEGGEGPDAPDERAAQLLAAASLPFRWIDLEEARDEPLINRLPPTTSLGRILSTHFPTGTPTSAVIERLGAATPDGTIRKVVAPMTVGALLAEVVPLLVRAGRSSSVLLTTGPSGALLRAWSRRFDFPFVYASLPATADRSAPGPVEVTQIPLDRLRLFFTGAPESPLFGVTGHPIAHSQSPYLHSRWMRAYQRRGLYVSFDISSESEFVESLGPLTEGGFRGLNVTHPWKSAALDAASRVGPGAQRCGAANCLSFRAGEIEAENTDLVAILRRLEEYRRSGPWDGQQMVVIGSGGAAAATLAAAQELGAEAYLSARREDSAKALATRFGAQVLSDFEARPFPLVVHATPVGRGKTGPLAAPLEKLVMPGAQVLDWVYSPADPVVRTTTEKAGGQYEDGWRLLVYQAAASFGIWWGEEPEPQELGATISEGPCTA